MIAPLPQGTPAGGATFTDWHTPGTPGASAKPAPVEVKTGKPVRQAVSPGETTQSVAYKEQIRVILPGGSVQQAGELTISPVNSQLPEILAGMERLAAYEISLGEQKTFDRPITRIRHRSCEAQ